MMTRTKLITGLSLTATSILVPVILYVPIPFLLCCFSFILGITVSYRAIDSHLLKHGIHDYLPERVVDFLTNQDLFEAFVDFIRENNPILLMFRLSALKLFNLNRDESLAVLNDISPFLSSFRGKNVLSLLPAYMRERFNPVMPECVLSPRARIGEYDRRRSLSQVLYRVLEARIKAIVHALEPPLRRVSLKLLIAAILFSLLSRSPRKLRTPVAVSIVAAFILIVKQIRDELPSDRDYDEDAHEISQKQDGGSDELEHRHQICLYADSWFLS